jgi:hypothetical protein
MAYVVLLSIGYMVSRGLAKAWQPPSGRRLKVVGQSQARFAVEVAAAGAHHLMMTGPPGVGKTMLAQRLPGCCRRCRKPNRWR